jgi:predicted PurR-regulated permease PerM
MSEETKKDEGTEAAPDGANTAGESGDEVEENVDRATTQRGSRMSLSLMDADALAPIFFGFLFLATTAALIFLLRGFIADLVLAFILVGLFRKPYELCRRHLTKNQWVASGLITAVILMVIVAPTIGLIYTIATEASSAFNLASASFEGNGMVERIQQLAQSAGVDISRSKLLGYVDQLATYMQELALSTGSSMIGDILSITMHLATVLAMVFYIQVDGERLRIFLYRLSPLPDAEDALLVETFKKVSLGVVVGNGLGSIIQGVLGGLAMWWFGLSSPVLWGSIMALFAFLPLVGISVVTIPAGLVLVVQGQEGHALFFLAFCFAQGLIVENVVKTKLMGSAMRMHDLLVFLSILGGIAAFGIIGLIYGPLIAMLFMTLNDLYDQRYRPKFAQQFTSHR